jgi:hypothetical protein
MYANKDAVNGLSKLIGAEMATLYRCFENVSDAANFANCSAYFLA